MKNILKIIFIFFVFLNLLNAKEVKKEKAEIYKNNDSVVGVIKGIYSDGKIGNQDNIFLLVGFNDAEKLYQETRKDPKYKEILPNKKDFVKFLPTKKDFENAKFTREELLKNKETWGEIKNVLPTKKELQSIFPSKEDWRTTFPSQKEKDEMYRKLTADFEVNPLKDTRKYNKNAKESRSNIYEFFVEKSLEYSSTVLKGSKNIILSPYKTIKSIPDLYSNAYDSSQDMYYSSSNVLSGATKWSARLFWVNIEGTYYLAVEVPAKFAYNTLKTLTGIGAPVISIPIGAIAMASTYIPIPFVYVASNLVFAGELLERTIKSSSEYTMQYVARPILVSGVFFGAITVQSGANIINTSAKFTIVVIGGTSELIYYLVKPVVVGTYIVAKPIYGILVNLVSTTTKTAYSGISTVSNVVWKGALYGYSTFSTTLATIGAGAVATPRFIVYNLPTGISKIPFNIKYKYKAIISTNINFKELSSFADKYSKSSDFSNILNELNLKNAKIKKNIKKYNSYIYLTKGENKAVIMFYIKKQKNTKNTIHLLFGFNKNYLQNNGIPNIQKIQNNINNFLNK